MGGQGKLVVLEGMSIPINKQRVDAFNEVMKNYPDIEIMDSQPADWSTQKALALMENVDETPALLISDFHLLDGSTGVEAVSAIREFFDEHIPAFIVSGDTSKVVKEARLLDNCTLMCKPIDTNRLLAAARHAVKTGEVPLD